MKKILAFDIDGTSINGRRRVSDDTINVLKEMSDAGYFLVPTTGRCLDAIPSKMTRELSMDYAITSNGSRVTNLKSGEDSFLECIPYATAAQIIRILQKNRVLMNIHVEGQCYDESCFVQTLRRIFFNNDFTAYPIIRDMATYVEEKHIDVEKIQVFALSRERLERCVKDMQAIESIAYPMSQKHYLEITIDHANKGNALEHLAESLDIDMSAVVAVGDDTNDLEMFRVAGTCIAMGNAREKLKDKADHITDTNKREGFAKGLKEFVLNNKEGL